MAERMTMAIVCVQKLYCRNPFYSTVTHIGVAIPNTANLISHKLLVFDSNSKAFVNPGPPFPNLDPPQPTTVSEPGGLQFHGWRVANRDENLDRWLLGFFHWVGDGADIVQAEVGIPHGNCSDPGFRLPPKIFAGVVLDLVDRVAKSSFEVREAAPPGPWVASLPKLSTTWDSQGKPAPTSQLPNYKWWGVSSENTDTVNSRFVRIKVQRNVRPTQIDLSTSISPSIVGNPVTFTATVIGSWPTGTVTFSIDGVNQSPVMLITPVTAGARQAQLPTSSLTVGSHSIVATYSGDSLNAGSTSATLTQVIN